MALFVNFAHEKCVLSRHHEIKFDNSIISLKFYANFVRIDVIFEHFFGYAHALIVKKTYKLFYVNETLRQRLKYMTANDGTTSNYTYR